MGKTRGNCKDLWEGRRKSTSSFQDPTSYSPIAEKSKSLSLSPPFCCFCWESCPLSGYHALSEHLPPSGPIFRKQMGSKAIPLPLQTAESGTLRAHLHTVALPETSHPWQGAHSAHISHSRSKPCLIYLLYFSYMSQCFHSLCFEGGWVTQCYALLHRGGGSALSYTTSQGTGEEDSARRMTPANALQSNILALRQ